MISPSLSIGFFLRTLVTIFCLSIAIYQVSMRIDAFLDKPTSTSTGKGTLRDAFPLIWVCRKPGINTARLQELGYASLEDLRLGRWNGEGSLDWSANNTIQVEQLYREITRFEGESLLEGDIVANTEREAFAYESRPV